MDAATALRLLDGSVNSAACWIGVVNQAVGQWQRRERMRPPTRDRVLAAVLRKACAQAMGVSVFDWWRDDEGYSARLEHVLEHQNEALVAFLREALDRVPDDPPNEPQEHAPRLKRHALAAAAA